MPFGAGEIVRLVFWMFLSALALALVLVVSFGKTARTRVLGIYFVLCLFSALVALGYYLLIAKPNQIASEEAKSQGNTGAKERKARYEAAKSLFNERCKTAGERIYRSVDDVEGVFLLNVRPGIDERIKNERNPRWADAGLPQQYGGIEYIRSFIEWEHQQHPPERGYLNGWPVADDQYKKLPGYSFVDVKEDDEQIYRYHLEPIPGSPVLHKEKLNDAPARYAISYRSLAVPQDWVAGTTVTVTDTKVDEIIAEKTWYSFEPGMGSLAGHRIPWQFAVTCPELNGESKRYPTRMFVDQVLKPKKGE